MNSTIKKNLRKDGIVLIPSVLDTQICHRALNVIENILKTKDEDILLTEGNIERKICYAFEKDDIFLDILSSPAVITILQQLYGDDISEIVPTWEDILIKKPLNGIPVEVHQDLGLSSLKSSDVFSLAFYFNDSICNPVNYLKGSQKLGPLDRNQIKEYSDPKLYTPYCANMGDVTIHNVLTIHYSDPNTSSIPRYTWYLEFRTVSQIVNDSPWDLEWAMKRQAIMAYAIENRKSKGLDFIDIKFKNYLELKKYIKNINLKVLHIGNGVEYTDNKYNHFENHKTLF